ncbi:MAG: SHOCT domain-containing protein [Pirellulales bacterium]|nr:SHOCT domain-containing protein [Pirellulales bacterium]
MALETVKLDVVNAGFGRPASVALQFRCVPKSQNDTSVGEPEISDGNASAEERLMKLSDLKDKGIITEEEYQQKRSEIITSL